MRAIILAALLLPLTSGSLAAQSPRSTPRITFELVTDEGFPINGAARWVEVFKKVDNSSVRIRGARAGDEVAIRNRGSDRSPSYHVVGVLTGRNRLLLPGGNQFTLTDGTKLARWVETLRSDGIAGLTAVRVAFGLTSEQLLALHDRLKPPVTFETKGVRAGDVARAIVRGLGFEVEVTSAAQSAFARNETVPDELTGLSSGTALAAVLRPLGLVVGPRKTGGELKLFIADVRESEESWPIGWPPKETPAKTAPKLFEYLNVEIQDTPLSDALDAIQPRVEVPFLMDHNSLARQRIDPAQSNVSFPRKRTFYQKILATILFSAGLKSELRVDEAGTPFLWISTTRR